MPLASLRKSSLGFQMANLAHNGVTDLIIAAESGARRTDILYGKTWSITGYDGYVVDSAISDLQSASTVFSATKSTFKWWLDASAATYLSTYCQRANGGGAHLIVDGMVIWPNSLVLKNKIESLVMTFNFFSSPSNDGVISGQIKAVEVSELGLPDSWSSIAAWDTVRDISLSPGDDYSLEIDLTSYIDPASEKYFQMCGYFPNLGTIEDVLDGGRQLVSIDCYCAPKINGELRII